MRNKFSTSAKLYFLIFITATSLIGLGLYAIDDLKKINDNTETLYADRILCIQQLSSMRFEYDAEILPTAQNVKNHITFSDAKKRIFKAEGIINTNWHNYKRTYLTPEERLLMGQAEIVKAKAFEADANLVSILPKQNTLSLNKLVHTEKFSGPAPFAVNVTQLMD